MDSIQAMTTWEHTWCLVLVRTQGPINLGLCLRACANLGVTDIRLVRPQCEIDCDDSRKFANHARAKLLELPVYTDLPAAVADCDLVLGTSARPRDGERGAPRPLADIPDLVRTQGSRRSALVFGNEQHGLDDDELSRCQAFLHLETPGDYPSYNLSHAVAIVLHDLVCQDLDLPATAAPPAASQTDRERLLEYWMRTLHRFRFFRRTGPQHFQPQLRAILNRLPLQREDCEIIRGMLAQFNYHMYQDKAPPPWHATDLPPDGHD